MGDPVLNCACGVCCDPLSENQHKALASIFEGGGMEPKAAMQAAEIVLEHFDLAPQGTLQPFKDAIAKLARGANYKA